MCHRLLSPRLSCSRLFPVLGFACMLSVAIVPMSVAAADAGELPVVGAEASDFELTSVSGELSGEVRLGDVVGDSPVVLVVLRGYPGYQCGLCARQAGELVAKAEQFASKNAKVLMVYPGPKDKLEERAKEFLNGQSLPSPFTMLLDPDYEFTNAYGLRWDAPNETAYPSTLIIDGSGKFSFVRISKSHGGRVRADEILGKL